MIPSKLSYTTAANFWSSCAIALKCVKGPFSISNFYLRHGYTDLLIEDSFFKGFESRIWIWPKIRIWTQIRIPFWRLQLYQKSISTNWPGPKNLELVWRKKKPYFHFLFIFKNKVYCLDKLMANIHILFLLKSFLDSRIHAFGFEFRIHEYGSQRFESHESNGKLGQRWSIIEKVRAQDKFKLNHHFALQWHHRGWSSWSCPY